MTAVASVRGSSRAGPGSTRSRRDLERPPLWGRKRGEGLPGDGLELVGHGRERELRLRLSRSAGQHREASLRGTPHELPPDRGLADPSLVLEDEHAESPACRLEEPVGEAQLRVGYEAA